MYLKYFFLKPDGGLTGPCSVILFFALLKYFIVIRKRDNTASYEKCSMVSVPPNGAFTTCLALTWAAQTKWKPGCAGWVTAEP